MHRCSLIIFLIVVLMTVSLCIGGVMAEDCIRINVQGSASARAEFIEIHLNAESIAPIAVNAYNESLTKVTKAKEKIMGLNFVGLKLQQSMTQFAAPSANPYGMNNGTEVPAGSVRVGIDLVVSLVIAVDHNVEDVSSKIASIVDLANTEKVTFKKMNEYAMMQGLDAHPVRFRLGDIQALEARARLDAIKKSQSYVASLRSAGIKVGKLSSMGSTSTSVGSEYAWMGMMARGSGQGQSVDGDLNITVSESLTFEFERLD